MRKHGLKVLGLALMAAIGLMAFSATSALAAEAPILNLGDNFYSKNELTNPQFLVESKTLSPLALTARAIAGKQIGSGRLGIKAKSAEIVCAKGEGSGTVANEYENWKKSEMEVGAHAHVSLVFKECKTEEMNAEHKLTGKTLTNCVPNPVASPGEIKADVLLLGKYHKEPANGALKTHVVAVPLVNTKAKAEANEALTSIFTNIKFGELCSLPPSVNITGSASFLPPTTDAIKPILDINTLSLSEQELIGTRLKFGASDTFIEAKVEVELPTNPGVAWGVM